MKKNSNKKVFYEHKIDSLLNVTKIVTIHYQELSRGYVSEGETHDFWEINYADKKSAIVIIDSQRHVINQGEMVVIPPNKFHYLECDDESSNIFIISFKCKADSMPLLSGKVINVADKYRFLLQNIMTEARESFIIPDFDPNLNKLERNSSTNIGGEQVIKNALELLLIYMLRQEKNFNSKEDFFLSKVSSSVELEDEIVKILSSKIYDTFDLNELCDSLHYGKTFLCTFFKKKTGRSIYATYLKLKVDEAKKLIRKKLSLTEIAEKLYFDSLSHLNYVFKKYAGMTPGEYKHSIIDK